MRVKTVCASSLVRLVFPCLPRPRPCPFPLNGLAPGHLKIFPKARVILLLARGGCCDGCHPSNCAYRHRHREDICRSVLPLLCFLGLRTDGYKLFNFNLLDFHLFHAPNGTKVQPAGLAFRAALEARKWDSSSRNVSVDLRIWPAELSPIRDWFPCSSSLAASGQRQHIHSIWLNCCMQPFAAFRAEKCCGETRHRPLMQTGKHDL